MTTCPWANGEPIYRHYHDEEWGRPVEKDTKLFEKICLEGFQSGLSWITILRKRENFRAAFCEFQPEIVATFTESKIAELLDNPGIVRHEGKIRATINNANKLLELLTEFPSFATYIWQFEPKDSERPANFRWETLRQQTTCPSAIRLSKDLKKRGFKFVGPTTAYAFMQAMGMVNDHVETCHCRAEVELLRQRFNRP